MNGKRLLYLLRHAKSSWDDPSQADHDRSLSDRGQRAVRLLADYVQGHEIQPQLILCSDAQRTRATLAGVYPGRPGEAWSYLHGEVKLEHGLYTASADAILERLREVPPPTRSVMVIGHNPALQMLAVRLAGSEASSRGEAAEGLAEIRRKLPTGALVTLSFAGDWATLSDQQAQLTGYVRPKTLPYR